MELSATIKNLCSALGSDKIKQHEPMRLHTTFKVGGPADIFITPETTGDVSAAVRICHEAGVPLLVVGNGSNLLVRDGGIRGAVLQLGDRFSGMETDGTVLRAQGGALLGKVAAEATRQQLCGMEFASGIPGSVGGAAAMNAGAYDGEMKDIVQTVEAVAPDGRIVKLSLDDMEYTYRHSRALSEGLIITEVAFALHRGDMAASLALTADYTARRRDKQPLEWPSAGSFFKRPPGYFAGKLISDAGLKGFTVGGAKVSEKHAGFVINAGGATARDVLDLAAAVRARVLEQTGVALEMEVRTVGED